MPKEDKPLPKPPDGNQSDATTPAEEWGDRVEAGRKIARGGTDAGEVPGATGDDPEDPRSGND